MTPGLSANTQAILLLTAPLLAGRGTPAAELLTPGEYKRLARHLREIERQPSDLVRNDAADVLRACQPVIGETRLQRLLGRGFLLSQVVERWQARAIWVLSRADAGYPRRLKQRLREDAPALIYGCGDPALLDSGGLAVVGSRHVDDTLIEQTMAAGRLVARAHRMLFSGGAKGIDAAAMRGALDAGGKVSGVLADSLERTSMNREHRNLLQGGQLVLISPYDPNAGFNVGHAMQRNKLIYALADAALVVSSDLEKGGTWAGVVEQLDKLKFVPIYVRSTGEPSPGLDGLRRKGALDWPNPQDADALVGLLDAAASEPVPVAQPSLALFVADEAEHTARPAAPEPVAPSTHEPAVRPTRPQVASDSGAAGATEPPAITPADALYLAVRREIQRLLRAPMRDAEVAAALDVSTSQAKAWLQRLVDEGVIERQKRPAAYVARQAVLDERRMDLFAEDAGHGS
jgi:DNA processing protein